MSENPIICDKKSLALEVEAGTYFWCACGMSSNQPFCDGSHKGTDISPVKHTAEKDGKLFFCGCKKTDKVPLCDGTHSRI